MKHNKRTKGKVGMKQNGTKQPPTTKQKELREKGGGAMVVTITWKKGVHGIGVIWGIRDHTSSGNTNVKSLNRLLGHHVRPVRPVCAVA